MDLKCSPARDGDCLTKIEKSKIEKILGSTYSNKDILALSETKKINDILKKAYRPIGIWDDDLWLYDIDLENVLEQYEDKYSNFKFLGVRMSDFVKNEDFITDKLDPEKSYAIIFRLKGRNDNLNFPAHWVTIFFNNKNIEYFDPAVVGIPNFMVDIIKTIALHWILITGKNDINFIINTKTLQKTNGDCGIFAIDYITSRLKGLSLDKYTHEKFDKNNMIRLRKYYFNN